MVLLINPLLAWQNYVVDLATRLWRRLLAFEELLANGTGDPQVDEALKVFASEFLWMHGTIYREFHGLLAEGRLDEAAICSWRVFCSIYHEKGWA